MYCVGVDIGGTTVKLGLFKEDGTLVEKWEIQTRKENAGATILLDVSASIHNKLNDHNIVNDEVKGIGIGVPGPVTEDGTVLGCVNLGWGVFNVSEQVRRLTGIKNVKVGNDANVAALGEMFKGGGQGYKSIVMITLGTGVGGGVIINNKMITGSRGAAGEIGHILVNYEEKDNCNCGKSGCLEQYASATGIVKEAKRLLAKTEEETPLRTIEPLTAKDICDQAKAGDKVAMEIVEQLGWYLGLACAHIAQVVDPEVFVIGGGVSKAGKILTEVTKKNYSDKVIEALKDREFVLATLGNDAGIYGSAYMVIQ